MSEYFLGKWSMGNRKPYINKEGVRVYMDRLVAKQPLTFDARDGKILFNVRKLAELPTHLLKSQQLEKLKEEALCNFEFLLAKLMATSLDVVLEDFSAALKFYEGVDDIGIIETFMRLSAMALMKDPRQLASQTIGRLKSFENSDHPFVSKFVRDAYNSTVTCFIPSLKCLTSPGGSLVSSMEVGDQNAVCEFSCNDSTVFVGYSTEHGVEIKVLDIRTGKLIRRANFTWQNEKAFRWFLRSSAHHSYRLLVAGSRTILLVDIQAKTILQTFDALSDSYYNFHYPVAFSCNEDFLAALTDTALKIWDTSDASLVYSQPLGQIDRETVRTMDAMGTFVVYSLCGEGLHVFDVSSGRELDFIEVSEKVKEIKVSSKQEILVLPASRKRLYLYDLDSRCLLRIISDYEAYFGLQRLQLTNDGITAVSFSESSVIFTNVESGEVHKLPKSSFLGNGVDCVNLFTRDGRYIHAVCVDKILRTYKYQPTKIESRKGSDSLVTEKMSGVYPGSDGRHIVTTSVGAEGQVLSVWDVPTARVVRRLQCPNISINEVRMLNSTQAVAKIFAEERGKFTFGFIDLLKGTLLKWLEDNASHSWAMGFVNASHFLSFSRVQRRLELWDITTGHQVQQREFGKKFRLADVLLSDNRLVVVCSLVRRVTKPKRTLPLIILNTKTDEHRLLKVRNKQLKLQGGSMDNEGHFLLCTSADHTGLICNVDNGKPLNTLPVPDVLSSGFSSKLQLVVTSHRDGTLLVTSLSSGQILRKYRSEPSHKVLVSDNRPVVFTFGGNEFYAWDLHEGRNVASFTADWEPTPRHVYMIADHIVVCLPNSAQEMTLRLQEPGSKDNGHAEQSPYKGHTLEGIFQC